MHLRTALLPALLTACGGGDIDGLWTGDCTTDADDPRFSPYYGEGSADIKLVWHLRLAVERQRRDIDGSGHFGSSAFDANTGEPPDYDFGGYSPDYVRDSGGGDRFRGKLDGSVHGDDIRLELEYHATLIALEGTLDGDTIKGTCTVGSSEDGYDVYLYGDAPAFEGEFTLKRR